MEPITLPNGQQTACHKCKLCIQNRIKDWAGRNVAQSLVSTASFAGDLTYGPELGEDRMPIPGRSDHIRAAVLTYSDVQKFLKYLRWLGYEFQYFITGEFGSLKGRVHWHFILHFTGKVPKVVLGKNFSDRHKNEDGELFDFDVCKAWPHGFMYWKRATYEDTFYNCKYITKDEADASAQRKPGLSKKPPIGARYFEQVAQQAVEQGIAPQSLTYRLPGIKKKKSKEPVEFYLADRSAELYLDHFIRTWAEKRGDQPRPKSDLVDLYEEYGQIVHDEQALILRRQFPDGESRLPMPTGADLKDMAKVARAELEAWKRDQAEVDSDHWWFVWVREAENEQERQKRQAVRDAFERERDQAPTGYSTGEEWLRKHGFVWDAACNDWVRLHPGGGEPHGDGEQPGQHHEYGLGRVGTWNAHFGDKAQADAGEANGT